MMGKRGTLRRHRYDERVTMLVPEGLRLVVKLTLRMGIGQARRGLPGVGCRSVTGRGTGLEERVWCMEVKVELCRGHKKVHPRLAGARSRRALRAMLEAGFILMAVGGLEEV